MSKSQMTTSDNLRQEVWHADAFKDTLINNYFLDKFASDALNMLESGGWEQNYESSPDSVLQVKVDLEARGETKKRKGDKITFKLIYNIDPETYAGVTGGQVLEGNELSLDWADYSITLQRYRQAVAAAEPLSWHRAAFSIPESSRQALVNWGRRKIQLKCMQALATSPTTIFYNEAGTIKKTDTLATAKTALTLANSKLTPLMVSFAKTWAMTGGGRASNQVPLMPIYVGGRPYYVLLTHPDAIYDWRNDSTVSQAHREALERGKENPIFSGAEYIWDGVIIHTHEYVRKGTDAGSGSNVAWTHAHLLGQQALLMAVGERPDLVDYYRDAKEDLFYAWRMTIEIAKPQFNSKDYGSLDIVVARTNVSGIATS
ncbi:MAG: DUF4043 family protein [Candidatus Brocadia sp.]|nr:DUF4043 family protein [Candidatus Brocadia sp.]